MNPSQLNLEQEADGAAPAWTVAVDTGGTFSDCIALSSDGRSGRAKLLSSGIVQLGFHVTARLATGAVEGVFEHSPIPGELLHGQILSSLDGSRSWTLHPSQQGTGWLLLPCEDGNDSLVEPGHRLVLQLQHRLPVPLLCACVATGTALSDPLPPMELRLATTRATNALLEGRTSRVVLITNKGLEGLLAIGDGRRPRLFDLHVPERENPAFFSLGIRGRLDASGKVLRPIDQEEIQEVVASWREEGVAAAVALAHGHLCPEQEEQVADLLRAGGLRRVTTSSAASLRAGLVQRATTAVVDAALGETIDDFVQSVREHSSVAGHSSLLLMSSAGGLEPSTGYRPAQSLLSGPAAGVMGLARLGADLPCERLLGFDMGGTSTDVARVDHGQPTLRSSHRVGAISLAATAISIHTVAAGGGSICAYRDGRLHVGPESAGADPGPACYGHGGPLTITDVNLLLGRLHPANFTIPVDPGASMTTWQDLLHAMGEEADDHSGMRADLLEGLLTIANERMADAMRVVTQREGVDPSGSTLAAFGGAGGLHACAVSELLGISEIVLPADAGILSARGLLRAQREALHEATCNVALVDAPAQLPPMLARARSHLQEKLGAGPAIEQCWLQVRLRGQEASLDIEMRSTLEIDPLEVLHRFRQGYEARFEHWPFDDTGQSTDQEHVEVAGFRLLLRREQPALDIPASSDGTVTKRSAHDALQVWEGGQQRSAQRVARDLMRAGEHIVGPAIVQDAHATLWLASGWQGQMDSSGNLRLRRQNVSAEAVPQTETDTSPDALNLELFSRRFQRIAEDMGELLQRSAISTSIRERLDFSCALLTPEADLLVNAPHIPVHLGSLGECVRQVLRAISLGPGDAIVTNHPAFGGSHLPDVTVITGVFDSEGALLGYVASRAHHAEIGGSRPGSMPPFATRLSEEGVIIPPAFIARNGRYDDRELRDLLTSGPWPTRALLHNLTDIRAALAANRQGEAGLRGLATNHGRDLVLHWQKRILDYSRQVLADCLQQRSPGPWQAQELLDDGSPIAVKVSRNAGKLRVDLSGSAPQHPGNLNTPTAVVRSAVMYVLRLLLQRDVPLNEGVMQDVELLLPPGMLNPDFSGVDTALPAIVAGNTETSQRLVNLLLRAMGIAAASQGTMNNVIFGNERFAYYETLPGGCGATPEASGATAMQCHMTNTRLTDLEILEARYPVRVERLRIRRNSGGSGAQCGGHGIHRSLRFLEACSLSLVSQHRRSGPMGCDDGEEGAQGVNHLVRANGELEILAGNDSAEINAGDLLDLLTPGGGAWGEPDSSEA